MLLDWVVSCSLGGYAMLYKTRIKTTGELLNRDATKSFFNNDNIKPHGGSSVTDWEGFSGCFNSTQSFFCRSCCCKEACGIITFKLLLKSAQKISCGSTTNIFLISCERWLMIASSLDLELPSVSLSSSSQPRAGWLKKMEPVGFAWGLAISLASRVRLEETVMDLPVPVGITFVLLIRIRWIASCLNSANSS